jgi:hypothetical protein
MLVQVEIRRGFFENESVEVEEVEITIFSSVVVEIPLVCIAYVFMNEAGMARYVCL